MVQLYESKFLFMTTIDSLVRISYLDEDVL